MKSKMLYRAILPVVTLLVSSLACDVPGVATDEGENVSATETMYALATIVAGTLEPTGGEGETSSAEEPESSEDEPLEPSATPTITLTPTLGVPMVSVSVDTNCRFGPGDFYEYEGALLVGEQAEVAGKLADGTLRIPMRRRRTAGSGGHTPRLLAIRVGFRSSRPLRHPPQRRSR